MTNHHRLVEEFLKKKRFEDPDKYEEVVSKYAVIEKNRWKKVQNQESTVGLLGVQPSRISRATADKYHIEAEINDKDE